jgi:rubrerythrin
MKMLTEGEILEYAVKVEEESFYFYRKAAHEIVERDAQATVEMLAGEEVKHINWLKGLMEEKRVSPEELERRVNLKTDDLEKMVHNEEIGSHSDTLKILHIALKREIKTREMYNKFLSLSKMDETLREMFRRLKEKEQGHVKKINRILKNYQ